MKLTAVLITCFIGFILLKSNGDAARTKQNKNKTETRKNESKPKIASIRHSIPKDSISKPIMDKTNIAIKVVSPYGQYTNRKFIVKVDCRGPPTAFFMGDPIEYGGEKNLVNGCIEGDTVKIPLLTKENQHRCNERTYTIFVWIEDDPQKSTWPEHLKRNLVECRGYIGRPYGVSCFCYSINSQEMISPKYRLNMIFS